MNEETGAKVLGYISAGFLALHLLLHEYTWWPTTLNGVQTMTMGTFLGVIGIALGLMGFWLFGDMRSRSNFIATENGRWSWNPAKDRPIPAGPYEGVRLDGINAYGGSFEGKGGTLFYHTDAWRLFGANAFVLATHKPRILSELDPAMQRAVREWNLPAPYYVADAPAFIEARNHDYAEKSRARLIQNKVASAATRVDLNTIMTLDKKARAAHNAIKPEAGKVGAVRQWYRRNIAPEKEERRDEESLENNG